MQRLNLRLQDLRQSQRFLSKQKMEERRWKWCCIEDQQIKGQQFSLPIFSMSPQPKISIKRIKHSKGNQNHSNSSISISKQSQRSILHSKKAAPSNHASQLSQHSVRSQCHSQRGNIRFVYSNSKQQNRGSYYITPPLINTEPVLPQPKQNKHYRMPVKGKQIDENIEKEFMNVLAFGESGKEEYECGQPFPLDGPQIQQKVKSSSHGPPNFSFGQNQKEEFMSKYLNIKHETSHEIILSSKENSKKSEMMKQIREQKLSKYSRSSKSSGQIFVRGTFNKNNLNAHANAIKKKELMFSYRSQQELSLESSQSLVLQSYQNIMKKRGSLNRNYQY